MIITPIIDCLSSFGYQVVDNPQSVYENLNSLTFPVAVVQYVSSTVDDVCISSTISASLLHKDFNQFYSVYENCLVVANKLHVDNNVSVSVTPIRNQTHDLCGAELRITIKYNTYPCAK